MSLPNLPDEILEHVARKCDIVSREVLRSSWSGGKRAVDRVSKESPRRPLPLSAVLISKGLLEWAIRRGCPLNADTFALAAKFGTLDVLRTLRIGRCPHDSRVCARLAARDDADALMWAKSEGFSWNFLCCAIASEKNARKVLAWLGKTDCPCRGAYHSRVSEKKRKRFQN